MLLRSTRHVRPLIRTTALIAGALAMSACGSSEQSLKHDTAGTYTHAEPISTGADEAEVYSSAPRDRAMPTGGAAAPGRAPVAPSLPAPQEAPPRANTETYEDYGQNPVVDTKEDNLSTFAVDVDTASYTIARRKIMRDGGLPPASAVRVEEFVNFFRYDYPTPDGGQPFAVHVDGAPSPFASLGDAEADEAREASLSAKASDELILRVGIQGKKISDAERKPMNLTFLVDVSGSMNSEDKLGLAKQALKLLVQKLDERDTIALVTYAGNTRVVLPATRADQKASIIQAIDDLSSSGSTAMASGLQLAYAQAMDGRRADTVNRVIVLSDGDANVGSTDHGSMLDSIRHYVDQENITMTAVGLGMGNYKDTTMEQLANQGNGNYFYVDNRKQAKRVFVEDFGGTLQVIAKDVKIQVEFNPSSVATYRLIGYENRDIADEDFRDDKVDAGEIGAGHTVTALYAVTLTESADDRLGLVRIRHKGPEADLEDEASETVRDIHVSTIASDFGEASDDLRFAAAVMGFAEHLRKNPAAEGWALADIRDVASSASGDDADREELVAMIDQVRARVR